MQDHELRQLLQETHPVKPGQEGRAWNALRSRLYERPVRISFWQSVAQPGWRRLVTALIIIALLPLTCGVFFAVDAHRAAMASVDSQMPGIYATAYYSDSARAQVVWLKGMGRAGERPTFLDPSGPERAPSDQPFAQPNHPAPPLQP